MAFLFISADEGLMSLHWPTIPEGFYFGSPVVQLLLIEFETTRWTIWILLSEAVDIACPYIASNLFEKNRSLDAKLQCITWSVTFW